jgi:hypothetical protein
MCFGGHAHTFETIISKLDFQNSFCRRAVALHADDGRQQQQEYKAGQLMCVEGLAVLFCRQSPAAAATRRRAAAAPAQPPPPPRRRRHHCRRRRRLPCSPRASRHRCREAPMPPLLEPPRKACLQPAAGAGARTGGPRGPERRRQYRCRRCRGRGQRGG